MERISRALELARTQRDAVVGPTRLAEERINAHAERAHVKVSGAANDSVARDYASLASSDQILRSAQVELSEVMRERERILPPGSSGILGGPYKMLRTQVLKRMDQLQATSLAVISAASGAGKTLTAINLAIAIASDVGRSVLLVDFDLRNPTVHRRFGYEPQIGIEECLSSGRPIHEAMFKVAGYERLTVLAARAPIANSSELLRSQQAIDAMHEMRARYANRVLIFDLPPVLQADDALAFSKYVQAGLLVVGEGRTKRDDVTRTLELLHELPIVGTVLNGSRDASRLHY